MHPQFPGGRGVKPHDRARERRLARAGLADESDALAGIEHHGRIEQDLPSTVGGTDRLGLEQVSIATLSGSSEAVVHD